MNKYIQNLAYIIKHKYYVFMAGIQLKVPIWQLIIHDWSKFTPLEFVAYANYFYGSDKNRTNTKYSPGFGGNFDKAWLSHIHRNPHHYQHWILHQDNGEIKYLEMPEKYIKEMIADWVGAGKAKGAKDKSEVYKWYTTNFQNIHLHDKTRILVEQIINRFK